MPLQQDTDIWEKKGKADATTGLAGEFPLGKSRHKMQRRHEKKGDEYIVTPSVFGGPPANRTRHQRIMSPQ